VSPSYERASPRCIAHSCSILDMCELEESFIRRLAHMQASAMLQQGISNMLVHVSPDGKHVRALNIQGYVVVL
jgi:hypothetical protein